MIAVVNGKNAEQIISFKLVETMLGTILDLQIDLFTKCSIKRWGKSDTVVIVDQQCRWHQ
jgi:hypothetical protein